MTSIAGYHQHKNLSPVNQLGQANIQYEYDKANIERISNLKEILKPVIVWYKNDIEPDIPVTSIAGYHQHKNLSPINQLAKANKQCIQEQYNYIIQYGVYITIPKQTQL